MLDSVCTLSQVIPIQLTFDDGNIRDAVIALPALVDRGLTASFFVCAGRIGLTGYLDASAMKDITSYGMEIGSHGRRHVDWRRVDDNTLNLEIDEARKKIADVLRRAVDKVAIPFGIYDRRVLRRLRRSEILFIQTPTCTMYPPSGGNIKHRSQSADGLARWQAFANHQTSPPATACGSVPVNTCLPDN